MGIFGGIGSVLEIGGDPGGSALSAFERGSSAAASRLRKFRPFRVRSALGSTRLFREGDETNFDIESPFLSRAADRFQEAQEGGSEGILSLLRARARPEFDRQFTRLESRLLGQGRLGLNIGGRGTPELAALFDRQAQEDLGFQLSALEQERVERASSLAELGGISGLLSDQFGGLLNAENLQVQREIAAAGGEQAGLAAALEGRLGEAKNKRSLLGDAISGFNFGPLGIGF